MFHVTSIILAASAGDGRRPCGRYFSAGALQDRRGCEDDRSAPQACEGQLINPNVIGAIADIACAIAMMAGAARALSSFVNSTCAMSGGSDVPLPIPNPRSTTPRNSRSMVSPPARMKTARTDELNRKVESSRNRSQMSKRESTLRPRITAKPIVPTVNPAICAASAGTSNANRWTIMPNCKKGPALCRWREGRSGWFLHNDTITQQRTRVGLDRHI